MPKPERTTGNKRGGAVIRMQIFTNILLIFLIICAVAASLSKNLLNTILIFMSYSLVMSIIWILLESPDLAITEAAVGAGVTSVLFFVTLKKIHAIMKADGNREKENDGGLDSRSIRADAGEKNGGGNNHVENNSGIGKEEESHEQKSAEAGI